MSDLWLQVCEACGTVQYPRREVCVTCLGGHLVARAVMADGVVLSTALLHTSLEPETALPQRIATVLLDCGPRMIVFAADAAIGPGTRVTVRRDGDRYGAVIPSAEKEDQSHG